MKTTVINKYIMQYTILCSYVASNSVLFAESGDNTSAARQQGEELFGETYGRRNHRRNVYASLEMGMLWLGCLRTTTVVGTHGLDRFHDERKMSYETRK